MDQLLDFVCEDGVRLPKSVMEGSHWLILNKPSVLEKKRRLLISVAQKSHPVSFDKADIFVRVGSSESSMHDSVTVSSLMKDAAQKQYADNARVGAALLTREGSVFSGSETPSNSVESDRPDILEDFRISCGENYADLEPFGELMDMTTAIHAESVVIFEALRRNESPLYLAVTRMPCLACCRMIRYAQIQFATYVSLSGKQKKNILLSNLMEDALCGYPLEVFEGYGGSAYSLE